MRLNDLSYKVYSATGGAASFWRWEVFGKTSRKTPLKSGFVYGTIGDAKRRASEAMSKLADTGKMRPNDKRR
jgi:hypothetical protein